MSPEHVAEAREWLARVDMDLRAAERLLSADQPLIEAALFHLQQAAEKALKAYLTWQDEPFPRTHNLSALMALCLPFDAAFHALDSAAQTLRPYVAEFRYPTNEPPPTSRQADQARLLARQVVEFVLDRLPPEARA